MERRSDDVDHESEELPLPFEALDNRTIDTLVQGYKRTSKKSKLGEDSPTIVEKTNRSNHPNVERSVAFEPNKCFADMYVVRKAQTDSSSLHDTNKEISDSFKWSPKKGDVADSHQSSRQPISQDDFTKLSKHPTKEEGDKDTTLKKTHDSKTLLVSAISGDSGGSDEGNNGTKPLQFMPSIEVGDGCFKSAIGRIAYTKGISLTSDKNLVYLESDNQEGTKGVDVDRGPGSFCKEKPSFSEQRDHIFRESKIPSLKTSLGSLKHFVQRKGNLGNSRSNTDRHRKLSS